MQNHEVYMRRCLQLAELGAGSVSPNPMVGAVLVHGGKIIAENYHQRYGQGHAEALLIQDVIDRFGDRASTIFAESVLYVSLEPCAHQGKTPPCAALIVEKGIREVVVGCGDPFDQVAGKGVSLLKEAGVHVIENVCQAESQWVNRRFFTRIRKSRPYIILKWAETADGFFAPNDGQQRWISGRVAKQLVHRWRTEEDAVLVGTNTALVDNPQLTAREWVGRHPTRVLIDRHLRVPTDYALYDSEAPIIVFNESKTDWEANRKYVALEYFDLYLPEKIVYQLYLMDVQSLIVEGGAQTLSSFIQSGLWDEARVFRSPIQWQNGLRAPRLEGAPTSSQVVSDDVLLTYTNEP